jgi:tetratricopeptide (TPR) repeat protein
MRAIVDETRAEIGSGNRRGGLVLGAAIATALLLWGGWTWWEARYYRRAMLRIEEEIELGHPALAARELIELLARNPGSDEAAYWLGACEKMRGRPEAAAEAWARVPLSSTFWPRSAEGRMSVEIDRGRLADAEQLIKTLNVDSRSDESDASILLGPIYCNQGRVDEAKRLIETRWNYLNNAGQGASEKAVNLLRLYAVLQSTAIPVEAARAILDQAALSSPDDDRIWLGKANLAIRTGSAAEMGRLAELLGRRFEARAFLTVAADVEPNRADLRLELARLEKRGQPISREGKTLSDLLAPELGDHRPPLG